MHARATAQLQAFLHEQRQQRRLADNTVNAYQRDLIALQTFLDDEQLGAWPALRSHHLRQYLAQRHRNGSSAKTVQRMLSSTRNFYRYLIREGLAEHDPCNGITAPKAAKKLPNTLDVEQISQLVNLPDDKPLTRRDRAIIELFYSSGLRLSELAGLDLLDVDLVDASVRVTGKGNKTRIVPVGRYAVAALRSWLQVRGELRKADSAAAKAIFLSQRGTRLTPRAIQARLAHWAKRQGLGAHVHPHQLRHAFASHVLQSSGDLRAVQELLGHADISATQIYTHLDFQHLAKVYDGAHPRAKA